MELTVQTDRPRWMRPIREGDFAALAERAAADGHAVVAPTHVFEKRGEIVGAIALGSVVLALPWFHTQRCHAGDTKYFINQSENLVASLMPAGGSGLVCVPFMPASPLYPFIAGLGYSAPVTVGLTFKQLKG